MYSSNGKKYTEDQTKYVQYNMVTSDFALGDNPNNLERNTVNGTKSVVFPLNIYQGNVFPLSQYACESGPRSTEYDYLIFSERDSHPDAPSRFGYANFPNGYGSGIWPGRYCTPAACIPDTDSQPKDMAPARFYTKKYQTPFMGDHPTYSKSVIVRKLRG